jgi:hypothetical protein
MKRKAPDRLAERARYLGALAALRVAKEKIKELREDLNSATFFEMSCEQDLAFHLNYTHVFCVSCGQRFFVGKASPGKLQKAASEHKCPGRKKAGIKRGVK